MPSATAFGGRRGDSEGGVPDRSGTTYQLWGGVMMSDSEDRNGDAPARPPLRVGFLISGSGRTLHDLLDDVDHGLIDLDVRLVLASTPNASGLQHAEFRGIPVEVLERTGFLDGGDYSKAIFGLCRDNEVQIVVMAGFSVHLTVPEDFRHRVISSHPALAPAFTDRTLHGRRIHEAVLARGVKVSGCTIFFVDQSHARGPVILQRAVPVSVDDTVEHLERRILQEERLALREALQLLAEDRIRVDGRRVRTLPSAKDHVRT